jgi:hypothetical protein
MGQIRAAFLADKVYRVLLSGLESPNQCLVELAQQDYPFWYLNELFPFLGKNDSELWGLIKKDLLALDSLVYWIQVQRVFFEPVG